MVKKETQWSTKRRGDVAELDVLHYFRGQRWTFLERGFRWKGGEIDLVFVEPRETSPAGVSELVFVEVRSALETRKNSFLRWSIGGKKRQHLISTAHTYRLRRPHLRALPFRFDLVWIEGGKIEHWRNVQLN